MKTAVMGKTGKARRGELYWSCDLDNNGKKLRQTTLGFKKTTGILKTTSKGEDNPSVENISSPSLKKSDATVGQGV